MKHLPFKILVLCVLLPPLLFIFTVQSLEKYFKQRCTYEIQSIYTGDARQLLDGSVKLREAIHKNVVRYLKNQRVTAFGLKLTVTVTTQGGTLLFPAAFDQANDDLDKVEAITVARDNYRLLNDGLVLKVDAKIEYNSFISIAILLLFIFSSVAVIAYFYQTSAALASKEERAQKQEMQRLIEIEKQTNANLIHLQNQREQLTEHLQKLRIELDNEKRKASNTEDDMIDEMTALESKLESNLSLMQQQQNEIEQLKDKINQYEKEKEKGIRQKARSQDAISKRFSTLYKNLMVNERALDGFLDLPEEMKIKAEEVIHQLNNDPQMVTIKRKVFGKKNRETVLEVLFAYKGRLYFRNSHQNRIEVLSIGTKHTQSKDLAFLDKL
jgi:hypothetical protein